MIQGPGRRQAWGNLGFFFRQKHFFHFFFFFFSFRSCLDLVLWYFFKLHNTYNTNIERAVFCIQYLLSTLTWQVVQYSSCAMESLFKSIMHLLSLWPPAPPPSSCTCRLYYFKKCAKPPNSKKNLSIMGVGATERFTKKNYCILFNVITFTFQSRFYIWAHFNSVILQPWRSHHQRLAFYLEVKWQKFKKNLGRSQ